MKLERLKSRLTKKSMVLGGTVATVGVIYFLLAGQQSSLEEDLSRLNNDSMSIITQTETSRQENEQIVKSLETYSRIPDDKLASVGLDDLIPRIRSARTLKETLEQRYKLSDFSMSFSPMADISQNLGTTHIKVYANNIETEFNALTDELALSFCDSMVEEGQGYLGLEKVSLVRENSIKQEQIDKIADRNSPLPAFVKAKVVFSWKTLGLPRTQPQNQADQGIPFGGEL